MEFNRWISSDTHTYAYRVFKKNHTFMNAMLWGYTPTHHYMRYLYRKAEKTMTTQEFLHIGGKDANRVISDITEWYNNLIEFDNWNRLNTLVAINAYFEIYLSSVVSLAIESDPSILFSLTKEVDGIKILKEKKILEVNFFDKSELITKGSWDQRVMNYKKLFGYVPDALNDNISDLEKVRKLRNKLDKGSQY